MSRVHRADPGEVQSSPAGCREWPASGPGRLQPGPCVLARVSVELQCQASLRVYVDQALITVLVVLRLQWRLMLEGRTRTLRGPSPDLSPAETFAPSIECVSLYFCAVLLAYDLTLAVVWAQSNVQNVSTDTYCQHHLNIIRRRGQHGNKVRYRMDANYLEPYYWL